MFFGLGSGTVIGVSSELIQNGRRNLVSGIIQDLETALPLFFSLLFSPLGVGVSSMFIVGLCLLLGAPGQRARALGRGEITAVNRSSQRDGRSTGARRLWL